MKRFFDDVELGDELGPLERVVTDQQVIGFCATWGADGPGRFTSDELARKEGLPGAIVPGIMSMALLSQLVTDWYPTASLKLLDVIFRQPVPHNRPLKLGGTVTDKQVKGDEGIAEADLYLETAEGEKLVTGRAVLALPRRPGRP